MLYLKIKFDIPIGPCGFSLNRPFLYSSSILFRKRGMFGPNTLSVLSDCCSNAFNRFLVLSSVMYKKIIF